MRRLFYTCASFLALSPAAWALSSLVGDDYAQELPADSESNAIATRIDTLWTELVKHAISVDRLLVEVTDKTGADAVAPQLETLLASMSRMLEELESYPFSHPQDVQALKKQMAALTYVSQSYQGTIQKLVELSAYGSEELMNVFRRYKLDSTRSVYASANMEDTPQMRLYSDLADQVDDALYGLRKWEKGDHTEDIVLMLLEHAGKIERTHHMLTLLAPPSTDDQREALRPARQRLQLLAAELKEICNRILSLPEAPKKELEPIFLRISQATEG